MVRANRRAGGSSSALGLPGFLALTGLLELLGFVGVLWVFGGQGALASAVALAATVAVGAAVLACAAFAARSARPVPPTRVRTAIRDRARRTAFLPQRDPDARGRTRPRAPGRLVPTAA
ncbi:DUF6412 domain-containing protein [Streptomyces sp. NRRL S-87]|uniref:DUF6412 domain-containing protein n=1 Tax=Streptomyces sp. NRRL S-87 TaxID=1463920 RepID=UPI0004BF5F71|nr:DUF6412 domain-containing protein [Streptomyces sp. NRRL S-87]